MPGQPESEGGGAAFFVPPKPGVAIEMRHSSKAWAVALALLLMASPLLAQTAGRIQGTVTDNTGAPVPGVAVVATSPSLQGVHSTTTDSNGEFRFASVPPGTYAVKAELSGFKTVNQTDVVVGLDRTATVVFKLEVAVGDRDGHRHRRVAGDRHHEHDDRRQRHRRSVQPAPGPARHLLDRARGRGHPERRHRHGVLRLLRRREQLHHRRPQHDRHRDRHRGQDS